VGLKEVRKGREGKGREGKGRKEDSVSKPFAIFICFATIPPPFLIAHSSTTNSPPSSSLPPFLLILPPPVIDSGTDLVGKTSEELRVILDTYVLEEEG
jgi:hypothetical protein